MIPCGKKTNSFKSSFMEEPGTIMLGKEVTLLDGVFLSRFELFHGICGGRAPAWGRCVSALIKLVVISMQRCLASPFGGRPDLWRRCLAWGFGQRKRTFLFSLPSWRRTKANRHVATRRLSWLWWVRLGFPGSDKRASSLFCRPGRQPLRGPVSAPGVADSVSDTRRTRAQNLLRQIWCLRIVLSITGLRGVNLDPLPERG